MALLVPNLYHPHVERDGVEVVVIMALPVDIQKTG